MWTVRSLLDGKTGSGLMNWRGRDWMSCWGMSISADVEQWRTAVLKQDLPIAGGEF